MSLTKYVDTPKYGRVRVDRSIADLIYTLNQHGLSTKNCCSGLIEDHPEDKYLFNSNGYIQFDLNLDFWEYLCKHKDVFYDYDIEVSLQVTLDYPSRHSFANTIYMSITTKTNEERIKQWEAIRKVLMGYINK